MEVITDKALNTTILENAEKDITIKVGQDDIRLEINFNSIFAILQDRKVIVSYINKKLDELVEKHITKMANEEVECQKS